MEMTTELLQVATLGLTGIVGYFLKQTLSKVSQIEDKVFELSERTARIEGQMNFSKRKEQL